MREYKKTKADLHTHLIQPTQRRITEKNSPNFFNRVIDVSHNALGSGGLVGVINFDGYPRYEDLVNLPGYERVELKNAVYIPEKDILLVKGQEVLTQEGHVLVLAIERDMHLKDGRKLIDTLKEARDLGAVIGADHPFYRDGIGSLLKKNFAYMQYIDFLEGHNSQVALWIPTITPRNANKNAQKWYSEISSFYPHIGLIDVSDGDSIREIGRSYSIINMPRYTEITKAEQLQQTLREAIKGARLGKRKDSKLMALMHAITIIQTEGFLRTLKRVIST